MLGVPEIEMHCSSARTQRVEPCMEDISKTRLLIILTKIVWQCDDLTGDLAAVKTASYYSPQAMGANAVRELLKEPEPRDLDSMGWKRVYLSGA